MRAGLDNAIAGIARLNDVICWLGRQLAWLLLAIMTFVVLMQVFYRYVLSNPLAWTEELAIFAMIWMTFLVAPIAYRNGENVAIEIVRDLFKGRGQAFIQLVLNALVLLVLAVLLWQSVLYVGRGMGSILATLGVRAGWLYIIMPIGVAGMLSVGVEIVLKALRGLIDPATLDVQPTASGGQAAAE